MEAVVAAGTGYGEVRAPGTTVQEEHLAEGPEDQFTLKSGGKTSAIGGHFAVLHLQALLDQSPDDFRALLAIARGQPQDAAPECVERLKRGLLLHPRTGEIYPSDLRDILLSAYQETPDGPVLVNPFRLNDAAEAQEVERKQKEGVNWLLREVFKDRRGGPPERE
jgi:hypothetical protein